MKKIIISVISILAITACSKSDIKSVDYYMQHQDEMKMTVSSCYSNYPKDEDGQTNCKNANEAQNKSSVKSIDYYSKNPGEAYVALINCASKKPTEKYALLNCKNAGLGYNKSIKK